MQAFASEQDSSHSWTKIAGSRLAQTRAPKLCGWRVPSSLNPAVAGGVRKFHWHRGNRVTIARWPEPGQWSNPPPRNKCLAYRHRRPSYIHRGTQRHPRRHGARIPLLAQKSTNLLAAGTSLDSQDRTEPNPIDTDSPKASITGTEISRFRLLSVFNEGGFTD